MSKPSEDVAERRARLARLSLRLLPVALTATTQLAALAPAAQAAPPLEPSLTGTNPVSPGASLTPRIQGQADGVITSVVRPQLTTAVNRPITMAIEPGNTIRIYTDPSCTGTVAGEGTADELEKAGIEVEVAPESVTTFYATQSNGETSDCSSPGLAYRQVSTAPEAPTFASVAPASPANDNFPHLIGSADSEATVSIYTNSACMGTPLASGTGAVFATAGIQVAVADNSETTFYAEASMAGFVSGCSISSISYQEVTPPPPPPPPSEPEGGSSGSGSPPAAPHLRTVPGGRANDNTPLIAGSAPGASTVKVYASADCTGQPVAKGPAAQFASPGFQVQVVDNVSTVFSAVSAVTGGQSACSAPVVYIEDSIAPHTRITMGPAAKTAKRKAVFRFTDITEDTPGTVFLCKVDRGKWKACGSPLRLRKLKLRPYTLRVKAIDPAGNEEATGAKRRFKVIRRP